MAIQLDVCASVQDVHSVGRLRIYTSVVNSLKSSGHEVISS
jgi:hypothetical protein